MIDARTGQMLLENILANAEDDTLRLIYADWLEDAGQAERAAAIRYALWVARANHGDPSNPVPAAYWCDDYNTLSRQYPDWMFGQSRGFISYASATLDALLRHLPAIVRQHPIERVRASDRRPYLTTVVGGWRWYDSLNEMIQADPDVLPADLFALVHHDKTDSLLFSTEKEAIEALSRGILQIAKEMRR